MKFDADTGGAHFEHAGSNPPNIDDYDTEFGGPEERKLLEKQLLRKVDARMSILFIIYTLNYVSSSIHLTWSCGSEATGECSELTSKLTNSVID